MRKPLLVCSLVLLACSSAQARGMFIAPVPAIRGVISDNEAEAMSRAIESAVLAKVVGIDVVTPRALDTKLELDLAGACTDGDDASCVVNFAQSMGVRYVLRPAIARIDETTVLTVSIYDGKRAALLGQGQRLGPSTSRLLTEIPSLVTEVARAASLDVVVERPRATPYVALAELSGGVVVLAGSAATHLVSFLLIEPAYQRAEFDREQAGTWELARPFAMVGPVVGYLAGATLVGLGIFTWPPEES